ncbi:MAG: polysaccharide pyruvyl transferase family protein, partial [Clostridia bacterium]|nr:polysaccharide pyruvyl transferase family protein [Clostridia bacterium]
MKYANMIFNGVITTNDAKGISLMNIGEPAQILAIDAIYDSMEIPKEDRIDIDYYDLDTYNGEYALLPINLMFAYLKYFMKEDVIFSPKIIPVFLGIAIHDRNLSKESVQLLRNYAPVGCRDEFTLKLMQRYQIPAYLFGCITLTFPKRIQTPHMQKTFFIDVPIAVEKHIPRELMENAEYLSHMYYGRTQDLCNGNLRDWAKNRIDQYRNEATLIVTSRFHAALIGIASGIPTILVLNTLIDKYRWIKKFIPIYTPENFDKIDWNPHPVSFEELKEQMRKLAVTRIKETYYKYSYLLDVSQSIESEMTTDIDKLQGNVYDGFSYYEHARKYIEAHWNKDTKITYSMWGLGKTAVDLYQYIMSNYPNAKLNKVFDAQHIVFQGIQSEDPGKIVNDDDFVFVTSTQACYPAEYYFKT